MRLTGNGTRGRLILCLAILAGLSGCTLVPPIEQSPEEIPVEVPRLPPKPERPPAIDEMPEPVAQPAPEPAPAPVTPPVEPMRVAVLLSRRIPEYESVAGALRAELGELDVYDLGDKSRTPAELLEAVLLSAPDVVVAVGYRAAEVAARIDGTPVVYSQVFNTGNLDLDSPQVKGVAMLPPLDRQLAAWKSLNPSLSSVGAIIGPGHEALLDEAQRAGDAHGVRFESRLARSDRETLYLFTRLVPQIDGYWLFPDNRILSPAVLRQMLSYAARHQVQIAVFNDSLLSLGATLSATAVDNDIARTILHVADRLVAEEGDELPAVSPLTDIAIRPGGAQALSSTALAPAEGGH